MKLSAKIHNNKVYPERIIQFGEGNFLRAFCDWIIDSMNENADFNSSIAVVQPIEKGLIDLLNQQDGMYTLYLNGIKDGKVLRESKVIKSINRGINPYTNIEEYLKLAENPEMKFIISNTTEAGIAFNKDDKLEDRPQKSFPGKVTALLYRRYKHFNGDKEKGFVFIPCELISKNGENLKRIVNQYAKLWALEDEFIQWINESNIFCDSLVDRIVPGYPRDKIEEITKELGYEDKLVVEGEQFHLWVIEGPQSLKEIFPADKVGLNVLFVDDLTPYKVRKVRILNGAHTSMVPVSLLYGIETVRETVEDKVMGKFVEEAIFDEIVPTLELPQEELEYFANAVIERFKNPYIKHQLISISLNSNPKFETRVLPSILEYKKRKGKLPNKLTFALAATIRLFKAEIDGKKVELKDNEEIIEMYRELWGSYDGSDESYRIIVETVLSKGSIWKLNLNEVEGLTEKVTDYLIKIDKLGMKEAIKEVI